jgi:hypothetical protein
MCIAIAHLLEDMHGEVRIETTCKQAGSKSILEASQQKLM